MLAFRAPVAELFGIGLPPSPDMLVVWDGFDQLDKERARHFFKGKNWEDVLQYLRKLDSAAFFLEEWVTLAPGAIAYYARAYLEHLMDTFCSDTDDGEFTITLFSQFYQLAYMYKGRLPFSEPQIQLLINISNASAAMALEKGVYGYWEHDIEERVQEFLNELSQHQG